MSHNIGFKNRAKKLAYKQNILHLMIANVQSNIQSLVYDTGDFMKKVLTATCALRDR